MTISNERMRIDSNGNFGIGTNLEIDSKRKYIYLNQKEIDGVVWYSVIASPECAQWIKEQDLSAWSTWSPTSVSFAIREDLYTCFVLKFAD